MRFYALVLQEARRRFAALHGLSPDSPCDSLLDGLVETDSVAELEDLADTEPTLIGADITVTVGGNSAGTDVLAVSVDGAALVEPATKAVSDIRMRLNSTV